MNKYYMRSFYTTFVAVLKAHNAATTLKVLDTKPTPSTAHIRVYE